MKNVWLLAVLSLAAVACQQVTDKGVDQKAPQINSSIVQNPNSLSGDTSKKNLPEINFQTTRHDFGKLTQGDKVSYDFKFTNTGKAPLLISAVQTSCGCTTSYYPRRLIAPRDSDEIKIMFDSKNKIGEFQKEIVVTANTYPNTITLFINGIIFK